MSRWKAVFRVGEHVLVRFLDAIGYADCCRQVQQEFENRAQIVSIKRL